MVIGVSTLRISLPVFVAEQHGLFAKHGIEAEVRRFDTAQPLADELGAGRIDAGGYVAFPILFGPGAPPPRVRVVTAIVEDAAHPLSYLLVKKGSGLRGVAALKGRRIGILPTAAYRRWLEAILQHDGLKHPDRARALAAALDEAIAMIAADPETGRAAMKPYVRETERPFVDRYPPARYLRSGEITAAQLDRALTLAGTDARAATVALPLP
jgi:ABC-type nitrate/sulfonate/bicarbonate transport system substrate-binding protein